ncbi:MAG: tetratricopeptide repeat protein [Leptospirales bacterium]|nr:tetratricopeptide repeat protein [Leptospirales bacterium]
MIIIHNDPGDSGNNNIPVEKNRINKIETAKIDEPQFENPHTQKEYITAKQKFTVIVLGIVAVTLISVLLIINFFFNKRTDPSAAAPSIADELIPEKDRFLNFDTENPALKKAIASYNSGYIPNAITEFTEVVESSATPKDKAIALMYLGTIARKKGEYDNAVDFFNRAINYDPNNSEIYINLARAYREKKNYNDAVRYAEKAYSMNTKDISALKLLGDIYYELTDWDRALKYYEQALKIDDNNPILLYNTAMALFRKGERLTALEFLKRAADADKIGDVAYNSYVRLGAEFLESNMFDLAEKYLVHAVHLRPSDPMGHYNLAVAYLRQNKNKEALKELEDAERLGQTDMALLENIGESYFSLKDYDKSLKIYNKVLEASSQNVRILARLGEIYYERGDINRAYDAYRKITQLQPATENARIAYLNMGNILDDAENFDDAVKSYESALAIRDNDDLTYYNLGLAYTHGNKQAMAINSWKMAAQINPENVKVRLAIADYYYEQGYNDQAEKEYQEIVYKWSSNQEALYKLGTIYHRHQNYGDAKKAYSKVIETGESTDFARKAMIELALLPAEGRDDDDALNDSIKLIQRALLLKPNDSDALLALGIIYARKEMHPKAVDTFYQAIKSTNDSQKNASAYNNMGKSYFQMKEYNKSIQAFNRAVEEDPSNEEIRLNRNTAVKAYENELEKNR